MKKTSLRLFLPLVFTPSTVKKVILLLLFLAVLLPSPQALASEAERISCDVVVAGGGAGGISARAMISRAGMSSALSRSLAASSISCSPRS